MDPLQKREIIEEVWLINAVRNEPALPEYDTISGFIRETMHVVGEVIARERKTQKQISLPENTDLKIFYNDGCVSNLSAVHIHGTCVFRDLKNWVSFSGWDMFRYDFPLWGKGPAGYFQKFPLTL